MSEIILSNHYQIVTIDSKMFVYAAKVIGCNYLFRKPSCKTSWFLSLKTPYALKYNVLSNFGNHESFLVEDLISF